MAGGTPTPATIGRRRWLILVVGITAQATACAYLYGLAFLIPELRDSAGVSLALAGLLVTTPILGLMTSLVAWGAAADRHGERIVLIIGLSSTGVVLLGTTVLPGLAALGAGLAVAGACAASVNAASGRVVLGWFPATERGTAMGLRQAAQPIGLGIASATLPWLGDRWGFRAALGLPAVLCLVAAALVALLVIDPPRPDRPDVAPTENPADLLWRLYTASALLVGPQFVAGTFALTYLVSQRGWDPITAGQVLAVVQVIGAAGRIAVGAWSDRVGSRLRPLRLVAVAVAVCMLLWFTADLFGTWLAVVTVLAALVITVAPNGLAFTAVAEIAGPFRAGRALGTQNTGQNAMALITVPLFGAIIGAAGYSVALLLAAVPAMSAALLVPVRRERATSRTASMMP
jgi:sugar phosphate permease